MEINSLRDFNKLFNRIDKQGTPEYFSGPRFINTVRQFDAEFPDYKQYIDYRVANGLSTSRKSFFNDILASYGEDIRRQIVESIKEEIGFNEEPQDNVSLKPSIVFNDNLPLSISNVGSNTEEPKGPTVFISYSWDNDAHKDWVLKLANKLFENGVNVLLDVYELSPGRNMIHFMEDALRSADKVIVIFTPNYKLKSEKREGGVGYEYSILNIDLYRSITTNSKYIPILKDGTITNSLPEFMQQFIAIDMTNEEDFDKKITDLLLAVYDKPQIPKPALGRLPDFI